MRAAVYWAPAPSDPLWALGCAWLGRDAETGAACPQPALPGIAELTASPRRYGFHATLRPPMRLATGWNEFRAAVAAIARTTQPFELPALQIAELGGFLALRESSPCPALRALADRCVELTNPHRLPPAPDEVQRRQAAGLSARQQRMLQDWGYPYVMQDWFFHMTLTRRLEPHERSAVRALAQTHFASALEIPRVIDAVTIFTQQTGDFLIAERFDLLPD